MTKAQDSIRILPVTSYRNSLLSCSTVIGSMSVRVTPGSPILILIPCFSRDSGIYTQGGYDVSGSITSFQVARAGSSPTSRSKISKNINRVGGRVVYCGGLENR